ncbi:uncharacterized protein C8Q71DRAFT_866831 [Rhodofomes roseus]|uniref:GST N-terminal domain-containing protein n=1 Tax=Rhodofomes roseus TaxID=34475 RepID=A0ABQ8KFN0_9APHY|nr:uncharacterized protein C8Q71DRAFT_866831 [Rhodofomes roseus]KAH9836481.1 hypothetical protein C8Q71DRAFT_866831 [Rhodofomes roseus]
MSEPVPKAALYYFPTSVWEEKGYGADELDLKLVDISKGENYAPSYLRLNPQATVPTLVVPLQKTLAADMESRYKAIQDSKSIVEFLDKSRSTQSRTNTTSDAPAPSLSPATIAFSAVFTKLIDLLHSPAADPNALTYMNARTPAELRALAAYERPKFAARRAALAQLLADNEAAKIRVSEKTRAFWEVKKVATEKFLDVYDEADTPAEKLDDKARERRTLFLSDASEAWARVRDVLTQLNQEIIGPYTLGDQLSLADLHLAAWLARLITLAGGTLADDGTVAIGKLEAHVGGPGGGFALVKDFSVAEARRRAGLTVQDPESRERQNRLAAFWDAVRERQSFKNVYKDGLH